MCISVIQLCVTHVQYTLQRVVCSGYASHSYVQLSSPEYAFVYMITAAISMNHRRYSSLQGIPQWLGTFCNPPSDPMAGIHIKHLARLFVNLDELSVELRVARTG